MAQLIYTILALLLIMFLSMNMQRGVGRDQQEQSVNEVGTQLTSVGTEVMELIGTQHFDWYTWNQRTTLPYCGRIADNGQQQALLSDPAGANFGACMDPLACPYIEGFEGLTFTWQRGDFDYDITVVSVEYVDPTDFTTVYPATSVAPRTFAKKVSIEVENPYLYIGDDPTNTFRLTMERVFTYGCTTGYRYIPFLRATDPPPSNRCPADRTPAETPCAQWPW